MGLLIPICNPPFPPVSQEYSLLQNPPFGAMSLYGYTTKFNRLFPIINGINRN